MKTIAEMFNNTYFRIPDYQRGYAWTDKQLSEFWDDIEDLAENQPHYTGTIFVEEMKEVAPQDRWLFNAGSRFYSVVDGQQRLTTVSILLYELLKKESTEYNEVPVEKLIDQYIFTSNATGNSRVYHFSYLNNEQNDCLLHDIFEDKQIIFKSSSLTAYDQNLLNAKNFFAEKISCLYKSQRDILFKKVSTALKFDFKVIDDCLDVQAVFETMNNRGKPLTVLEKLKNRLIYMSEKLNCDFTDKQILRKNINDTWGLIYSELARNPENILDEDDFLAAHLSLYRQPTESVFSQEQAEIKIFQMFSNKPEQYKETVVDFDKINHYVHDLAEFVSYWVKANNQENLLLQKIYLLDASKELKIYICSLFKASRGEMPNEDLRTLEKIVFRANTPHAWQGRNIRSFASLARDIYKNPEILQQKREELNEELKKEINLEMMANSFSYLFTYVRGNIGFHRWHALKYLLFEYEEYLHGCKFSHDAQKMFIKNYHQTAIEHIMPRNLTFWQKESNDFLQGFADDQRVFATNILVNSLGNLTILGDSKNSSVSNSSWNEKRERYRTGSFNEIEISENETWNKQQIWERGKRIMEFLLYEKLGIPQNSLAQDELEKSLFYSSEYYKTGFAASQEEEK
jgi:hypothetical protein